MTTFDEPPDNDETLNDPEQEKRETGDGNDDEPESETDDQ
jgi:hypothetical protein